MADVLAFNLTEAQTHAKRSLTSFDLSTKLKLMGVDVASFGDFFADSGKLTRPLPGSKRPSRKGAAAEEGAPLVKALTYRDPFCELNVWFRPTPTPSLSHSFSFSHFVADASLVFIFSNFPPSFSKLMSTRSTFSLQTEST